MLLAAHAGLMHNSEISHPCFAVLVSHAGHEEAEEKKTQFIQPDAGTGGLLEAVPCQLPAAQGHLFRHGGERSHEANRHELFGMRG